MSDETVVVVTGDETPDADEIATAVADEIDTGEDNTATVAAEVADAVGDAVAETVAAIESHDATDDLVSTMRHAETNARIDALTAQVEMLAATLTVATEREAESDTADEVIIEDDEIVPNRRHAWFRPLSEWKGDR